MIAYPCSICNVNVGNNSIRCDNCCLWVHLRCSHLSKLELSKIKSDDMWHCSKCRDQIFPFASLDNINLDSHLFGSNVVPVSVDQFQVVEMLNYFPFKYEDKKFLLNNQDLDPENNIMMLT